MARGACPATPSAAGGTRVLRETVGFVLDDTMALHTVMEASDVTAGGETIMIVRLR